MLATIPAIVAAAAPATSTVGTGTIQSISIDTKSTTKVTTVDVTLMDGAGLAEKVGISLETAVKMGLVITAVNIAGIGTNVTLSSTLSGFVNNLVLVTDPGTGITSLSVTLTDASSVVHVVSLDLSDVLSLGLVTATVDTTKIGTSIAIDPTVILNSTTYSKSVTNLGNYFGPALGVTFDQLAADFAAGYGYGVITQAAWMTSNLGGNATLLDQILTAKSTGDYSGLVLPGGVTATNWGQIRKLVLTDPHQNLGSIMSGKATLLPTPTAIATTTTTTSNGNGNSNGNGHGNGHGNGNNNGNGSKK
ncbi:MAG: hypothetical protein ABSA23_15960 [Anaerolineales bacterium]|jgi:hypothetical protein